MPLDNLVVEKHTPPPHQPLADLIDKEAKAGKKTVHFADTNHNSTEIRQAASAPEVMAALKRNEFKTFVIEGDPKSRADANDYILANHVSNDAFKQLIITDFAKGVLYHQDDPSERKQWAEAYLEQFNQAHHGGIAPVMPDPRYAETQKWQNSLTSHEKEILYQRNRTVGNAKDVDGMLTALKEFETALSPEDRDTYSKLLDEELKINSDPNYNQKIIDNTKKLDGQSGDTKRAYIYGAMHSMSTNNDLDDRTPHPTTIALATSPGENAVILNQCNTGKINDLPNHAYYTEEHRTAKLDNVSAGLEFIYGPDKTSPPNISPEESALCKVSILVGVTENKIGKATHTDDIAPPLKTPSTGHNGKQGKGI